MAEFDWIGDTLNQDNGL